jgi:hypothetical protein
MNAWNKSIIRIIYVVCDGCTAGCDRRGETAQAAIDNAKSEGWIVHKGQVLCCLCQKEKNLTPT